MQVLAVMAVNVYLSGHSFYLGYGTAGTMARRFS